MLVSSLVFLLKSFKVSNFHSTDSKLTFTQSNKGGFTKSRKPKHLNIENFSATKRENFRNNRLESISIFIRTKLVSISI